MRKLFSFLLTCLCSMLTARSQNTWTNNDRAYLASQLTQTRVALEKETVSLSSAQWNFKESADRWSIKEVVEHIVIWELLLTHEVSRALGMKPDTTRMARADSVFVGFILEDKPHISVEYTKPFTYTLPMGINSGENNLAWFQKMRNESINFIDTTQRNLRLYYLSPTRPNVHQVYIYIFGHTERHLRQIRKIKAHSRYPKQ